MLKKVLAVVGLLVLGFVVYVALQPARYEVERSHVVKAPRDVVFALVGDLERFNEWSPWAGLDPDMDVTVTGEPATVETVYHWKGDDDVGEGKLTITAVEPGERIEQRLEFFAPFESVASTTYELEEADGGTQVTWTMEGDNDFMGKLMDTIMNMEAMIGADYDKGLAKLDQVAQADAEKARAAAEEAAAEEAAAEEAAAEPEAVD